MASPTTVEKAKAELSLRTPKKSFLSPIRYTHFTRCDSGLLEQADEPEL
jgi:hypothetical protein